MGLSDAVSGRALSRKRRAYEKLEEAIGQSSPTPTFTRQPANNMTLDIMAFKRKRTEGLTPEVLEANRKTLNKRQRFSAGQYMRNIDEPRTIARPPAPPPECDRLTAALSDARAVVAKNETKKVSTRITPARKPCNVRPKPMQGLVADNLAAPPVDASRYGRDIQLPTPSSSVPSCSSQKPLTFLEEADRAAAPFKVQLLSFQVGKLEKANIELKRDVRVANAHAKFYEDGEREASRSLSSSEAAQVVLRDNDGKDVKIAALEAELKKKAAANDRLQQTNKASEKKIATLTVEVEMKDAKIIALQRESKKKDALIQDLQKKSKVVIKGLLKKSKSKKVEIAQLKKSKVVIKGLLKKSESKAVEIAQLKKKLSNCRPLEMVHNYCRVMIRDRVQEHDGLVKKVEASDAKVAEYTDRTLELGGDVSDDESEEGGEELLENGDGDDGFEKSGGSSTEHAEDGDEGSILPSESEDGRSESSESSDDKPGLSDLEDFEDDEGTGVDDGATQDQAPEGDAEEEDWDGCQSDENSNSFGDSGLGVSFSSRLNTSSDTFDPTFGKAAAQPNELDRTPPALSINEYFRSQQRYGNGNVNTNLGPARDTTYGGRDGGDPEIRDFVEQALSNEHANTRDSSRTMPPFNFGIVPASTGGPAAAAASTTRFGQPSALSVFAPRNGSSFANNDSSALAPVGAASSVAPRPSAVPRKPNAFSSLKAFFDSLKDSGRHGDSNMHASITGGSSGEPSDPPFQAPPAGPTNTINGNNSNPTGYGRGGDSERHTDQTLKRNPFSLGPRTFGAKPNSWPAEMDVEENEDDDVDRMDVDVYRDPNSMDFVMDNANSSASPANPDLIRDLDEILARKPGNHTGRNRGPAHPPTRPKSQRCNFNNGRGSNGPPQVDGNRPFDNGAGIKKAGGRNRGAPTKNTPQPAATNWPNHYNGRGADTRPNINDPQVSEAFDRFLRSEGIGGDGSRPGSMPWANAPHPGNRPNNAFNPRTGGNARGRSTHRGPAPRASGPTRNDRGGDGNNGRSAHGPAPLPRGPPSNNRGRDPYESRRNNGGGGRNGGDSEGDFYGDEGRRHNKLRKDQKHPWRP